MAKCHDRVPGVRERIHECQPSGYIRMVQIRLHTKLNRGWILRVPKLLRRGSSPQSATGDKCLRTDTQCLHPGAHNWRIASAASIKRPVMIGQLRIGPARLGVPHENEMFVRHLRFARRALLARVNAVPDN